jgi:chromosomal replication initiation ATPase DnaA
MKRIRGVTQSDLAALEARLARIEAFFPREHEALFAVPFDATIKVVGRVAFEMGMTRTHIIGQGREAAHARARFAIVWVVREAYGLSYPQIGRQLGGRDHTTIMAAYKRAVAMRTGNDPSFVRLTDKLLAECRGGAA